MPLHIIRSDVDLGSRRHEVLTQLILTDCPSRHQPAGRIDPQRLLDDLARVRETGQVLDAWYCPRGRALELLSQFSFDTWVLRQQIPDPVQGARGRLVASHDQ